MEKTKGSGFLKVTGILMIIGGGLSIILGIVSLLGLAVLASLLEDYGLWVFAAVLALVGAIIELVTGIVGCVNCKKPEKATACLVWGIIVAAITVVSEILSVVAGGEFSVVSLILGLVLPVLFIIGAVLNKKTSIIELNQSAAYGIFLYAALFIKNNPCD